MATPTRSEVRTEIARILTEALVGDGKPIQAAYKSFKGDIGGQSPVLIIPSAGTHTTPSTQTSFTETYFIDVYVLVAYADPDDIEYDSDEVEDTVDDLCQQIMGITQLYARYPTPAPIRFWKALRWDDRSTRDDVMLGGYKYWVERIPLRFEMY
jgi:hypothetical protein